MKIAIFLCGLLASMGCVAEEEQPVEEEDKAEAIWKVWPGFYFSLDEKGFSPSMNNGGPPTATSPSYVTGPLPPPPPPPSKE